MTQEEKSTQNGQTTEKKKNSGRRYYNGNRNRKAGDKQKTAPASQKPEKKNAPAAKKEVPEKKTAPKKNHKRREVRKTPVKIIPLGGLDEIGKNMTAYECQNDIFIVDCGLAFPDDDMLGVDIVIPDFTYIENNADRVRGIVITHGHEDHIGGLAYLLKRVNVPVYASKLTAGLIEAKLKEHGLLATVKINVVEAHAKIKLGCMSVETITVNHSVPGAFALAITTPAGVIIQTGDFKVDYTPIDGNMIDLARFGELGTQGVLALLSDSTNAERPGSTPSERKVGESFETLFQRAGDRRMIIASFSTNILRIQQIVDLAVKTGRRIALSGRSMLNVVSIAMELGYLKIPQGVLVDIDQIGKYPPEKMVIITTGSQGEPMSALSRMAMGEHRKVEVTSRDFIIISATPIPGNEKLVDRVVNELLKLGAEVIYEKMYEVHVSGHACQDELKMMIGLTKPKFFLPVHGEYKHLKKHAQLAVNMGISPENVLIGSIGNVIETDGVDMKITGNVPAGRVLVDGLGVGDVGSIVLRDRKHLAQDGLIVIVTTIDSFTGEVLAGPDIVSRGFVYVRESEALMEEAKHVVKEALSQCTEKNIRDWGNIKVVVKDALSQFVYKQTQRSPMILPVIMEI